MKKARLLGLLLVLFGATVSAQQQQYLITTVAGRGLPPTPMAATAASVNVAGVAVDQAGNAYFSSYDAVFKVDPTGTLTRVAGAPGAGPLGDGGPALGAHVEQLSGVALDSYGNLYFADWMQNRVRMVTPGGTIFTVAGTGTAGYSGDGQSAIGAQLSSPEAVAVDAAGIVYIADAGNSRVRMVMQDGRILTVAGNGTRGYSGDGGPATSAEIWNPVGLAIDAAGNLYIADSQNNRIRMVTPGGNIYTVVGTGTSGYSGDGGSPTSAEIANPGG